MAIEVVVQRLQIGDVVLIALPDQVREGEARWSGTSIERRRQSAPRATLHVQGREDSVKQWLLGELIEVVRGP